MSHRFLNLISDTSLLKEGDLLKLYSHHSRKLNGEEEEHGPSIKLHPAANEYSTRATYIHGALFWTVLRTWTRDWVFIVNSDGDKGWANIHSNTLELCDPRDSTQSTPTI